MTIEGSWMAPVVGMEKMSKPPNKHLPRESWVDVASAALVHSLLLSAMGVLLQVLSPPMSNSGRFAFLTFVRPPRRARWDPPTCRGKCRERRLRFSGQLYERKTLSRWCPGTSTRPSRLESFVTRAPCRACARNDNQLLCDCAGCLATALHFHGVCRSTPMYPNSHQDSQSQAPGGRSLCENWACSTMACS